VRGVLLRYEHLDRSLVAGVLARGAHSGVVLLVIGGILMIVGTLRLLGFLPGLSRVNLLGRSRLPPAVEDILILLLGAAVVVVGIVVMNR
jgi:hypothetical protein